MTSPKRYIRLKRVLGVAIVLAGSLLTSSCQELKTGHIIEVDPLTYFLDLQSGVAVAVTDETPVGGSPEWRSVATASSSFMSYLERQTDGSLTQLQYLATAPYSFLGSAPNYRWVSSPANARTFQSPTGWKFLADRLGVSTQSLVFANLLGDGTPVGLTLAPAGFDGGPNAYSLLAVVFNPDGSTKSINFYAVPANPVGILVADFNKDGKDDVVVVGQNTNTPTGWTNNSIAVYVGNGDGTLKPPVFYSGDQYTSGATAYDFNGDGNLDLAVVNAGSGDVSILLGKGDGTFASAVNYPAIANGFKIVAGDFNGDGHADLAVSSGTAIATLLGNGDGSFRSPIKSQAAFSSITGLAAGDYNKDGKLDLAVSDSTNGTVSILLGDGAGKFPNEYDYAAGYGLVSTAAWGNIFATDLDGDGNLDVVAASGHPDVLTATPYLSDVVVALFGRGDGTLIAPPAYWVGTGINALAVADFNGDGKPDIAAASGSLWILLASGGGNFKTPVSINLGSGVSAGGVAAADLRGDGKMDVVVGDLSGSGVYVLLGNGDGTFRAPVRYPVGGMVTAVAIADFNGDGKPDIAFCGSGYAPPTGSTAGILIGNGDGTFQPVKALSGFGTTPVALAAGDFNHDGKADLAIADQGIYTNSSLPGGVVVYLGKGDGSFQSAVDYPAGFNLFSIASADLNGDQKPDLIVGTLNPNYNSNGEEDVAVLLGNGDGTFQPASYNATEEGPAGIAVADLNGDGQPDLAIAHCCANAFATYMRGNGDGTFQPEQVLIGAYAPNAIAAADLTGDGKMDLVAGLWGGNTQSAVAIFLNQSPAAPAIAANVSAANSTLAEVSPGSIATAWGTNLATTTAPNTASTPPTALGGTSVTIQDASGASYAAPLFYVSPTQINYEVPDSTATGKATVTITSGSGASGSISTSVATVAPGVFVLNASGLVAAIAMVVAADNSVTYENVYQIDASGNILPRPVDLSGGQVYLELYGTGIRYAKNVAVTIGGRSVPVLFAGAQGYDPGLDQINVGPLAASLQGSGQVSIALSADGQSANTTNVTFQ